MPYQVSHADVDAQRLSIFETRKEHFALGLGLKVMELRHVLW